MSVEVKIYARHSPAGYEIDKIDVNNGEFVLGRWSPSESSMWIHTDAFAWGILQYLNQKVKKYNIRDYVFIVSALNNDSDTYIKTKLDGYKNFVY